MDLGTVLSAAQTLFAALQCAELKEIPSVFRYKSQLDELQRTVSKIKAVLRDAENKQKLSHEEQHWIDELKDAVFEVDDLFDEFVTLTKQKQLLKNIDGSLSNKISHFFSSTSNPLSVAYRMSKGVKNIKKALDAVASNTQQFGFKTGSEPTRKEPTRKRRTDTCSYVNENIIGRDEDLEKIVGMLLGNSNDDVSFLSIVGIGGLGKTALAQLVYNDPRVASAFQLRKWACVADQDQNELDVKQVLCNILGRPKMKGANMEQVQSQLHAQLKLKGRRYLIVLDDVWTEKREQWSGLVEYFVGDKLGSWIVVTTRSQRTATIVGGSMHELQGLSEENSWCLFERSAFASDNHSNSHDELVKIGREIVDGCARVPLAIRVAGSLLYCQDKSKWLLFKKIGLVNVWESDNGIMPILKLSYYNLESPLKSCFSYCALFPKDSVIPKRKLINLWMAQGFIVPLVEGQSVEEAGEEYFSILLRRCFFQDIVKDNRTDEIESCKIHDLMHDIAQSVSRKEIVYAAETINGSMDKTIRHLLVANRSNYGKYSLGKTHIRSHLFSKTFIDETKCYYDTVEGIIRNCRRLRALDLRYPNIERLPSSLGELLHLRYLDLSGSGFIVLPKSITKLYNLQTLNLESCAKLKELPNDLSRLVNLRDLDISECDELTCMPRGMGKLSCLQSLSHFYVGRGWNTSRKKWFDELEDLKGLNSLKGYLHIEIWWPKNAVYDVDDDSRSEGLYLSKKHLTAVKIWFRIESDGGMNDVGILKLMDNLQPHPNLEQLIVWGYDGVRMPDWVSESLLPNLVILILDRCNGLKYLPFLRYLPCLREVRLLSLANLEYVEEGSALGNSSSTMLGSQISVEKEAPSYPFLKTLFLIGLPKLKGWRRMMEKSSELESKQLQPCLSQLTSLSILNCPALTCIPSCPSVEKLKLDDVNWLPLQSYQCIKSLNIIEDTKLVNLPDRMQFFTNLEDLRIQDCTVLEAMPNWMPKLTSLTKLDLWYCSERVMRRCQKDPPGEDWPYIQHICSINLR